MRTGDPSQNPLPENGMFRDSYPISQAVIRSKTVVVKREGRRWKRDPLIQAKRGEIKGFSTRSKIKLALVVTETTVEFVSLLTLTFGRTYPQDGKNIRELRNGFLVWLKTIKPDPVDYVWFLEFQVRGAPHLHILLDFVETTEEHKSVARNWSKSLGRSLELSLDECRQINRQHLREKVWENIRNREGAAKYVTKYALKADQKSVPKRYLNVGRFWGSSRNVKNSVPEGVVVDITENELRQWLANRDQKSANWDSLPKVLFLR